MSCEGKKYHIDEVRGGRGVTLCVGQRVHNYCACASHYYIIHDTCVDTDI